MRSEGIDLVSCGRCDANGMGLCREIYVNGRRPTYIIALIDHDPAGRVLLRVLNEVVELVEEGLPINISVATSNFLGLGLYQEAIRPLEHLWWLMSADSGGA